MTKTKTKEKTYEWAERVGVKVGDVIYVTENRAGRITKILPLGTVEVELLDGSRAYRVSGLRMR